MTQVFKTTLPQRFAAPPISEAKRCRENLAWFQRPEGEATKCSFAGIIELSARQMAEAGVSRVECPECLTMRALTPQGATVRFPPHDKRKTRTLHREMRWIRHGTLWMLAETKA